MRSAPVSRSMEPKLNLWAMQLSVDGFCESVHIPSTWHMLLAHRGGARHNQLGVTRLLLVLLELEEERQRREVALRFYVEYAVTVPGIFKYYLNAFFQVYKYLNQAFS